ncbi:hypothetical protein ODU73_001465 [Thermoclostridium stercorarium]|uniref:hypothetical protein n=1 Tax=Thermoclostridium stercorarium TaxID=1510 RepID=UPI002248D1FC|nr:hypothetical protein [Thermoclostridium stercorarium]UZQ84453.1 hypothetical protein ODU73_001465 [Thermoclostridium stercorarium]
MIHKAISVFLMAVFLSSGALSGLPDLTGQPEPASGYQSENIKKEQDPVTELRAKKEKIKKLLDEGKITREEAEKKIKSIDERIKQIEEFNKLPLEKKKEKLIENFKSFTEKLVKKGIITREKAEELLKDYENKVKQWDGTGKPPGFKKHHKCPVKN